METVLLVGGPLEGKSWQVTQGTKSIAVPCTAEGLPITREDPRPVRRGGWLVYDRAEDGKFKFYRQTQ